MKIIRYIAFVVLYAACAYLTGCADIDETDYRENEYGYVQFKLYKAASYPDTKASDEKKLEYLSDATKIKVLLNDGTKTFTQTLVLNAADPVSAEFGLRSAKLKLLSGTYRVLSYTLYGKLDEQILDGTPQADMREFSVVPGGLCVHDLTANVPERGMVRFRLVKDTSEFVQTRANVRPREYTLDEIMTVDVTVRRGADQVYTFKKLKAEFSIHFVENEDDSDGMRTSTLTCDTLLYLPAGNYTVDSYTVYDDEKGRSILETNENVRHTEFEVADNRLSKVDVPVRLYQTDLYIQDYYALKEIWEALGGPEWYYSGENFPAGANWNFDKDVDLWGDQPGVALHQNGRVALISISDFGFKGEIPAAIAKLSELTELYLGTHNDMNQNEFVDPTLQSGTRDRMERHKQYLAHKYPAVQFSEPVARGLKEHNVSLPEIAMYDTMSENEIIEKGTGRMKVQLKDVSMGKLYNGLTRIDPAIWELDNLEKLTIANGLLEEFPEKPDYLDYDEGLASLTDLEIYNCRQLKSPKNALKDMPSLISLNMSMNNQEWTAEESEELLHSLAEGRSAAKIQILYMNQANLTQVDGAKLAKMKNLGLLDLSNNKIRTITPLVTDEGEKVNIVQLHLNNNLIEKLERHPTHGCFCGISDVETFSVRNNLLTEFPDIFDAKSKFGMTSVDFSYNKIEKFAGYGKDGKKVGDNKGIYVETLTLSNNPITTYPLVFRDTESKLAYINMRGCELKEIPDSAFSYDNAVYLTSFDLSYNHLEKFPYNFHAGNIPYLYGLDVSYNRFKEFPYEQFDMRGLTVFAIRGQRDEKGERCLTEWPTGVYNHVGLRGLYLGSNDIRVVDDTISTLCYYLDISDNPNIVFDASDICYAWQVGAYYLIYDKTQEIVGCDLMLD